MRSSGGNDGATDARTSSERPNATAVASSADSFSLVVGGPFYGALRRLKLAEPAPNVRGRILVLFALTWVPLLALAVLDGTAFGRQVRVPLLRDFSIYGRFFVALPLLIAAEVVIDPPLRRVMRVFDTSGIVSDADLPAYRSALESIGRLRDSWLAELLVFVLACVPVFMLETAPLISAGLTTWHGAGGHVTAAGWWFAFVSSPLLRFLLLRWLWRALLWGLLLYRVTTLKLNLIATHPDLVGGLGFVLAAQRQFGILFAAISSIIAGQYGDSIAYLGVTIADIRVPMVVFVCLAVVLVLCPLAFFMPQLIAARRDGMIRYSQLARELSEAFDEKWARGPRGAGGRLLGDQDPSSLVDYIGDFSVVRDMRVVPINRELLLQVAVQAAAPLAIVWIAATGFDQIVADLVKMLA